MKYGFKGDGGVDNAHRGLGLYESVNEADRVLLHEGFGKNLASHYSNTCDTEFDWDEDARAEFAAEIPRLIRLI